MKKWVNLQMQWEILTQSFQQIKERLGYKRLEGSCLQVQK